MALDDIVPDWDKRERHRLAVDAPAAAVIQAARELTWGEVPSFRRMMLIAAFGRVKFSAGGAVLDMFLSNGFEVLHHSDQELVIGGVERTLREQHILIGFNFRCVNGILSTETRVRATGATTRRLFAVYWFVIRAGSGMIRHIWLRGIRRRVSRITQKPVL